MYQNGRGVPQSFEEGARFYRAPAEQGFPPAQYMLGLMYDKGQGVPQDYVLAYMWVTLGVAGAAPKERPAWTRVRDAIATKMSLAQRSVGQRLALGKPTLRVPRVELVDFAARAQVADDGGRVALLQRLDVGAIG